MSEPTTNGSLEQAAPVGLTKWAAVAGRWRFEKKKATYEGPDPSTAHPLGVAVAGYRLRNGTLSTTIKLSRSENTAAGLIVGFKSLNSAYLSAQIGAFDQAYAIAEFRPGTGWFALTSAGLLQNLDISQPIHLEIRVSGQTLSMSVDEVNVLSYVLPYPIDGSGIGLYGWGDSPVEFTGMAAIGAPPKMFVIMPFSEPFDTLYRDVINPVAKKSGFEVVRVDEVTGPGIILDDIQRQIEESHAVVAEISLHNPNVFYELGYAHALRKPAVLLVRRQEGDKMPFDIRGFRAIFYDDSIGGKRSVERNLEQHLQAVLRDQLS